MPRLPEFPPALIGDAPKCGLREEVMSDSRRDRRRACEWRKLHAGRVLLNGSVYRGTERDQQEYSDRVGRCCVGSEASAWPQVRELWVRGSPTL